jgi:methenyltetrahydromethanopterin cyclohydrolase
MQTKQTETQLSELWNDLLPLKFPKTKCIEALARHLNINKRNVYARILDNKLLARDVSFLFHYFGIGYTPDRGFYFDQKQYEAIQQREEMENAMMFGLSKHLP